MPILISGSMAFDNILAFNGRFADHILPQQVEKLSVSFLTPHMRSDYGGCAGNIAYAVKQLGGDPLPLATVGKDGGHYLERLRQMKIDTGHVVMREDCYTAQCTIVTDENQNQITAFHPGAMGLAHEHEVPADASIALAIVSPNSKEAMQSHAKQLHAAGIRNLRRVLAGHPETDVILRQQDMAAGTIVLSFMIPDPEDLGRCESGQGWICCNINETLRSDAGRNLLAFLPSPLITPDDSRPDDLIFLIQHNQTMHLSRKADSLDICSSDA